MKPQRQNTVGRKSKQHPYHPHPKLSSVQSAVGCAHQKSDSTATNERAKIDHQLSQKSPSARNEPPQWSLSLLNIFLIDSCRLQFTRSRLCSLSLLLICFLFVCLFVTMDVSMSLQMIHHFPLLVSIWVFLIKL